MIRIKPLVSATALKDFGKHQMGKSLGGYRLIAKQKILMVTLLLGACGGGGSDSTPAPPIANPPPPDDTPVPLFSELLDCVDDPGSAVAEGTEFKRVTLNEDNAICNDGSQAVMYVRRAATGAGEQNWSINLQGGGSCVGEDCADRWCSGGDDRMSSTGAPEGSDFEGLFSRDERNLRPDANQVFLHYCSSDNFAGRRSDVVIPETSASPEFRIHFQGASILEAAIGALEVGAVSDDQTVTLPPLGGAGSFTISGTSAGCAAVAKQGDRLAARAKALGHSTQLICDGNFPPDLQFLPDDSRKDELMAAVESVTEQRDENHDPLRDDSCVALQTETPWRCDLASYVLANHITESPIFIRMDLGDATVIKNFLAAGYTAEEFARGVRDGLLSASEGAGVEQPTTLPSVYGPACRRHVALFSSNAYFNTTVGTEPGGLSLNEAIDVYANGSPVVLVDTVPPTLSSCLD